MTRIKELAQRLRSDQARQNGISQREMESCADLLDELSRIKSAALAESLAEIRQIHEQEEQDTGIILKLRAHRHRATLLDALRAKEAEHEEARLRYNQRVSELIQKVNEVTGERDAARTQFGQAQKELLRIRSIAALYNCVPRWDAQIRRNDELKKRLAQAERDKAALPSRPLRAVIAEALSARGWWLDPDPQCKGDLRYQPNQTYSMQIHDAVKWQIYCVEERVSSCPCPKCLRCCCAQIPELAGRDCVNAAHGVCDCARRDIKPDQGRYLARPDAAQKPTAGEEQECEDEPSHGRGHAENRTLMTDLHEPPSEICATTWPAPAGTGVRLLPLSTDVSLTCSAIFVASQPGLASADRSTSPDCSKK